MNKGPAPFGKSKRKRVRRPVSPYRQVIEQEARAARRRILIMAGFVLITLFLTLAMINLIVKSTAPEPKLYIVREGSIVSELYTKALVVRNEKLLKAPSSGMFLPSMNDGDKAGKGQQVARVISDDGQELWERLEDTKYKLSTRQLELMAEGSLRSAKNIYESTDDKLLPLINQLRRSEIEHDFITAEQISERMQVLVDDRNNRLMSFDSEDQSLKVLIAEKERAEKALEVYAADLNAPVSGLICYAPDNLAASLDPEQLMAKSAGEIEDLIKKYESEVVGTSRRVDKDETVAFAVEGVYQYLAFVLEGHDASEFPEKRIYTIDFPNEGFSVENCRLQKAEAEGSKLLLLFRSDADLDELIGHRVLNAKILMESDRGLKVPREALTFPDPEDTSKARLMLLKSGYVYDEPVEVKKMDRDYAIITTPIGAQFEIKTGSVIIQNPASVKAGEQLGG